MIIPTQHCNRNLSCEIKHVKKIQAIKIREEVSRLVYSFSSKICTRTLWKCYKIIKTYYRKTKQIKKYSIFIPIQSKIIYSRKFK